MQGVSTMGTCTLEAVAAASADPGTLMFQLYVLRDRSFTRHIVQVIVSNLCARSQAHGRCSCGNERFFRGRCCSTTPARWQECVR